MSDDRGVLDVDPGFRQLVERSPDAVIIGRAGRVLYANAAAAAALGFERPEELLGQSTMELVHPDERDEFRARRERALGAAENPIVDRRLRRRDGGYSLFEGSLFAVDFGGEPAVAFIGRDSEGRRRLQADFRALVEEMPGAVIVYRGGKYVYANRAALAALGYGSAAEILGRDVLDSAHAEDRAEIAALMARMAATDEVSPMRHLRVRRRDGSTRLLLGTSLRIEFEGGPARLMVAHDVTELHATEQHLRAIIDASPLSVLSLDPDYRVVMLNPAATRLFGWTPPHELLPQNRGLAERLCLRARDSGLAEAEEEVPRRDGSRLLLRLSVAPLRDAHGEVTGYVVLAADMTDVRRNERARASLQDALRRAEAMSAMGALVAGVAHEVRSPLFAMSATLDSLQSPPSAEQLQLLRREVERINRLMTDLLDYGKPPNGQLEEEPLSPVIAQAIRACAPSAEAAGVELENAAPPDLGYLPMQAGRLLQVFQNLIDNAVQHSPRGGRVRIEAAPLDERNVEVRVLDRGPGFRDGDLPHVFEPFFSRRPGGTGLGLSIVQRIAEQHRGSAAASNRDGGGACVVVRLPSVSAGAASEPPAGRR